MSSIFHFWKHLFEHRIGFLTTTKLEEFPFNKEILSCRSTGSFPDLAIKINPNDQDYLGGELVELKDSNSYRVASFNSTIPTGRKSIRDVAPSETSSIFKQMHSAGDNVYSLEHRDVFYLVRGKKKGGQKICLTHGSFFETISARQLISEAFIKVLEEANTEELDDKTITILKKIFSKQESFSKVRNIDKASVNIRFRVMTEVKPEGNILDSHLYPEIKDNTLNFLYPFHTEDEAQTIYSKMKSLIHTNDFSKIASFQLKHKLNGYFLVFQASLDQ